MAVTMPTHMEGDSEDDDDDDVGIGEEFQKHIDALKRACLLEIGLDGFLSNDATSIPGSPAFGQNALEEDDEELLESIQKKFGSLPHGDSFLDKGYSEEPKNSSTFDYDDDGDDDEEVLRSVEELYGRSGLSQFPLSKDKIDKSDKIPAPQAAAGGRKNVMKSPFPLATANARNELSSVPICSPPVDIAPGDIRDYPGESYEIVPEPVKKPGKAVSSLLPGNWSEADDPEFHTASSQLAVVPTQPIECPEVVAISELEDDCSSVGDKIQIISDALKKNRECQQTLRTFLSQLEMKRTENSELRRRVRTLIDFEKYAKRRFTGFFTDQANPSVKLISIRAASRPNNSLESSFKQMGDPHTSGSQDNADVEVYKKLQQKVSFTALSRRWTNDEREELAKGVNQQVYEVLVWQAMETISNSEAVCDEADVLENAMNEIGSKELTPEEMRRGISAVNWAEVARLYVLGRTAEECRTRWLNHEDPIINKSAWTKTEDKKLLSLAQQNAFANWEDIAQRLGTHRTPGECLKRYQRSLNARIMRTNWTPEEDNQLRAAVEELGEQDWNAVANCLEGRNNSQCLMRWYKVLHPHKQRKGRWSLEEDKRLKWAVSVYGPKKWKQIAQHVPGRTDIQCRERWCNVLNPTIKLGEWTEEEDKKLEESVVKHGPHHWSAVASDLKVRTDKQCWRRWKLLHPEHQLAFQTTVHIRRTALVSNFQGRRKERPKLGPQDFISKITDLEESGKGKMIKKSKGGSSGKKRLVGKTSELTSAVVPAEDVDGDESTPTATTVEPRKAMKKRQLNKVTQVKGHKYCNKRKRGDQGEAVANEYDTILQGSLSSSCGLKTDKRRKAIVAHQDVTQVTVLASDVEANPDLALVAVPHSTEAVILGSGGEGANAGWEEPVKRARGSIAQRRRAPKKNNKSKDMPEHNQLSESLLEPPGPEKETSNIYTEEDNGTGDKQQAGKRKRQRRPSAEGVQPLKATGGRQGRKMVASVDSQNTVECSQPVWSEVLPFVDMVYSDVEANPDLAVVAVPHSTEAVILGSGGEGANAGWDEPVKRARGSIAQRSRAPKKNNKSKDMPEHNQLSESLLEPPGPEKETLNVYTEADNGTGDKQQAGKRKRQIRPSAEGVQSMKATGRRQGRKTVASVDSQNTVECSQRVGSEVLPFVDMVYSDVEANPDLAVVAVPHSTEAVILGSGGEGANAGWEEPVKRARGSIAQRSRAPKKNHKSKDTSEHNQLSESLLEPPGFEKETSNIYTEEDNGTGDKQQAGKRKRRIRANAEGVQSMKATGRRQGRKMVASVETQKNVECSQPVGPEVSSFVDMVHSIKEFCKYSCIVAEEEHLLGFQESSETPVCLVNPIRSNMDRGVVSEGSMCHSGSTYWKSVPRGCGSATQEHCLEPERECTSEELIGSDPRCATRQGGDSHLHHCKCHNCPVRDTNNDPNTVDILTEGSDDCQFQQSITGPLVRIMNPDCETVSDCSCDETRPNGELNNSEVLNGSRCAWKLSDWDDSQWSIEDIEVAAATKAILSWPFFFGVLEKCSQATAFLNAKAPRGRPRKSSESGVVKKGSLGCVDILTSSVPKRSRSARPMRVRGSIADRSFDTSSILLGMDKTQFAESSS